MGLTCLYTTFILSFRKPHLLPRYPPLHPRTHVPRLNHSGVLLLLLLHPFQFKPLPPIQLLLQRLSILHRKLAFQYLPIPLQLLLTQHKHPIHLLLVPYPHPTLQLPILLLLAPIPPAIPPLPPTLQQRQHHPMLVLQIHTTLPPVLQLVSLRHTYPSIYFGKLITILLHYARSHKQSTQNPHLPHTLFHLWILLLYAVGVYSSAWERKLTRLSINYPIFTEV
jgi:hypothetical protein